MVLMWSMLPKTVNPPRVLPQGSSRAAAAALATPISASPDRNVTVHEHLGQPDAPSQLEALPR